MSEERTTRFFEVDIQLHTKRKSNLWKDNGRDRLPSRNRFLGLLFEVDADADADDPDDDDDFSYGNDDYIIIGVVIINFYFYYYFDFTGRTLQIRKISTLLYL